MAYRIRLIRNGDKDIPYEIGGITADNEQQAVRIAKNQIVEGGYWFPWENDIKQRYNSLSLEWIDKDTV